MPSLNLENMDVNALIELRSEIDMTLTERSRDLQRQLTLLDGHGQKGRGRPPAVAERVSSLRGVKVAPKYRGPGGETWAGRGVTPRWLKALIKQGLAGRADAQSSARSRRLRRCDRVDRP